MAKEATTTAKPAAKKAPVKKKAPAKKPAAKKPAVNKAPAKLAVASKEDFAVIETGGKQYIVSTGDVILVELLGDHKEGDKIEFEHVLLSDDGASATVGDPYIKGAKVKATYLGEKKGKKLSIIRFKAKSNFDRKVGHRQHYAEVRIESL